MPELPEVEALAVDLGARLEGRAIDRLDVVSFSALKTFDPPASAVQGAVVERVQRHGKFLDIVAGEFHVVVHLALAGWIRRRGQAPPASRPRRSSVAARLVLDEGDGLDITEAGTKKGLAIYIVRDPAEVPGISELGPDALSVDEAAFREILRLGGRGHIKRLLRSQSVIAGVGNAYSDEILHAARMSPFQPAAMSAEDAHRLYRAMRETLEAALQRAQGLAASELKREKKSNLAVHGRFGEACPVCDDAIQQVVYSDTSFQYCPTCQTGGKKLSDRGMDRLLK